MKLGLRRLALLSAAALLGTACSASMPVEVVQTEPGDQAEVAVDVTESPAVDQDTAAPSFADRIGIDVTDEDAMARWMQDAETEWRRLTAECMLAQGFEYSQQDWSAPGTIPLIGRQTSRDYAQEYGFGVVPAFLAAMYDPTAEYAPPNSAYLETLTSAELDEYNLALFGNADGQNGGENGFPDAGCAGDASATSFALVSQLQEIAPLINEFETRVAADPRVVALTEQWDNCMADQGYGGVAQDDLYASFSNRLVDIFRSGTVFAYSPSEIPELPQPDLPMNGPSWMVLPELNAAGQEKVDALLEEEIATALADFDCRQATLDDSKEIQLEYEAEFLDEYGSEIDQALAS